MRRFNCLDANRYAYCVPELRGAGRVRNHGCHDCVTAPFRGANSTPCAVARQMGFATRLNTRRQPDWPLSLDSLTPMAA